jgi:acyl-CoA hydrolase
MYNNFIPIKDTELELSELMVPSHSNFAGKIHGGFILSLMDKIAFACASRFSKKYCITASVDKVDFLSPVEVGDLLILKAKINYTGNSSMVVGIRVDSQNIQSGEVKHCNSSYFTMVARENNKPAKIPGLLLKNEKDVRRFIESMERKSRNKKFKTIFKDKNIDFSSPQYLSMLEHQNSKIDF